MTLSGTKPSWLTFDCYGTLIQWDEGLRHTMDRILRRKNRTDVWLADLLASYYRREHELEQSVPFERYRRCAAKSLAGALQEFGIETDASDIDLLLNSISSMPPFPEVVESLKELKQNGYRLCIISNTDDSIIAGNVAQLGGMIDHVITAEQAQAYKPSHKIFHHAYRQLETDVSDVVHICASPDLDLTAARELKFRCIWIDRGTGRKAPPDYQPDVVLPDLSLVPGLFEQAGW